MYLLAELDYLMYMSPYDSWDPTDQSQSKYRPDYYQLQNPLNVEYPVFVPKYIDCCHTCPIVVPGCDNHDNSSRITQYASIHELKPIISHPSHPYQ